MASFNLFKNLLAGLEGGYVSAATAASIGDKGGETYKGIARNFHPDWPGWAIVDAEKAKRGGTLPHNYIIVNATLDKMADDLYKKEYWDKMTADSIQNQSIANLIVDWGVNSGTGLAAKFVQRILGVTADGVFGPVSVRALNNAAQSVVFNAIKEARRMFIDNNPNIKDSIEPILIRDRVDSFFFREA